MAKKIPIIKPEDVVPEIRHSNYFQLNREQSRNGWGPRTITEYEFVYIVAGQYLYKDFNNNANYELYEGDVLCIHPGVKHWLKCTKVPVYGAIMSCIHLDLLSGKYRLKNDYQPQVEPPIVTSTKGDFSIHQLFRNCADVNEGFSHYRTVLLENIGREIWIRLSEYWEGGNAAVLSPRMRRMISYIDSKIPEPVTRQDLSCEFGLTPEHINVLFKQEVGMTPTQAVHRARINLARRYLLEEGLTIKETAEKVGFSDEFYFSKVFKKVLGITPGSIAWR